MIECVCRLDSQNVSRLFMNIVVRYRDVMRSERYSAPSALRHDIGQ